MTAVDFSSLPDFAEAGELERQAELIASAGTDASGTATSSREIWLGLGAVYSAPEAETAYGAFDKVQAFGNEAETVTGLIRTALVDFAVDARALRQQASDLIALSGQCSAPPDADTDPDSRAAEVAALQLRVQELCRKYAEAEDRCAGSIRAAAGLLPDSGILGSTGFGTTTSLADTVLEHVHQSQLHVRQTVDVSGDLAAELRLENIPYEVVDGGVRYTRSPSGILIPVERSVDLTRVPFPDDGFARPGPELRLNAEAATPPAWARWGGRGLFVLDAGITAWDQGSEQFNSDLIEHPDWTASQRALSVTENVAIVGGASLAAGAGGAWAGAKGGAVVGGVVGSWIPVVGTAAGAVAGGIVGGIAGGIIGSGVGEKIGKKAKDLWDSFWG
ncbi:hypothetical protein ITX31_06900 [Arthrobacter gandavensis]|uniref:hypothetical protein n=1 Tax=Arthrobacter gandavensis TaxID=169960 RepID=UPI0018908367|nr:hypothetical protein [Arthrobacter gandavensis]MBF4993838.1 hypothetical protein [Arthrobacter gandavensis]